MRTAAQFSQQVFLPQRVRRINRDCLQNFFISIALLTELYLVSGMGGVTNYANYDEFRMTDETTLASISEFVQFVSQRSQD